MGFMDKMKAAAQDVAQEAKKATAQAQSKVEELQTKKRMDDAARRLGYVIYRERSLGVTEGADADRLVAEIKDLEEQLAAEQAQAAAARAQGTGGPEAAPTQAGVTPPPPPEQSPPPSPGTPA